MNVYQNLQDSRKAGKKLFAILIYPYKQSKEELKQIVKKAKSAKADLFFVGGSLLTNDSLDSCIETLKSESDIPVILFPGNAMQVNNKADAILFLSLISGSLIPIPLPRGYLKADGLSFMSTEVLIIFTNSDSSLGAMTTKLGKVDR